LQLSACVLASWQGRCGSASPASSPACACTLFPNRILSHTLPSLPLPLRLPRPLPHTHTLCMDPPPLCPPADTHVQFLLEYCEGSDLAAVQYAAPYRRLHEDEVRRYATEILAALQYLHLHGVAYRCVCVVVMWVWVWWWGGHVLDVARICGKREFFWERVGCLWRCGPALSTPFIPPAPAPLLLPAGTSSRRTSWWTPSPATAC
jgi:hypothetical protein